jgi:hypothetical protein
LGFAGRGKRHARRSEEKPAIEETLRHSGLDPESSSSFKFFEDLRRFAPEFTFLDSGSSPE